MFKPGQIVRVRPLLEILKHLPRSYSKESMPRFSGLLFVVKKLSSNPDLPYTLDYINNMEYPPNVRGPKSNGIGWFVWAEGWLEAADCEPSEATTTLSKHGDTVCESIW